MKSMTGFGKRPFKMKIINWISKSKVSTSGFRYSIAYAKELNAYELVIRQVIKRTLKRGRVEVYVNLQKSATIKKKCACSGT